jgi:predicted secreted protein
MAISYSGGLYTLSGSGSYTPTDLYNNNSAGITRLNGSRIVYDFGSSRIVIGSGTTLTVDTDDTYGEIIFSNPGWNDSTFLHHIHVQSGGTLNLGNTYSQDLLMVSTEAATQSFRDQNREWRIDGTLNWYGGVVTGGTLQLYSGSSGTIEGYATFYKLDGVDGGSIRLNEADFVPTALRFFGGAVVPFVATTNPIKGLTFVNCATQPAVGLDNNNTSGAEFMECEDWDVSDPSNAKGFGFWDQRWAKYINQASGTDFGDPTGNLADNTNNRGLLEVRQSIEFSATSGGGAKFYTKDTNNGSRLAANQIVDNPDYTADRSYTLTESGGTASYDTDGGVLIGVYWRTTGGLQADNNNFDSRGNNNDKTDIFTWLKVEYGQLIGTLNVAMKGRGGVSAVIPTIADPVITETTASTVAAYTGIVINAGAETVTVSEAHTVDRLYDRIKYWESQNPSAVWDNGNASIIQSADGSNYSFLSGWTLIVTSAGSLSGVGQTISLRSGSVIDGAVTCDITLSGTTAQADDIENFGGSLNLTGAAVLTIDGGAGGDFPAGASGASAKFVISESGDNTYDATAYDFDASTEIEVTSGDDITVSLDAGQTQPTKVETSGTITFDLPVVNVTGEVTVTQAGSRIQVFNVTTDTEIANEILAGTSWSDTQVFGSGTDWSPGDTIRVRATYQNGLSATAKATTSFAVGSSENWSVTLTQETCPTYTAYGIDGSTVTEFSWDGSNLQFDVNDPDNLWYVSRLFAWDKYYTFTETGIRESFDYISAIDAGNIRIDNSAALDNLKTQTAMQADQVRLFRPNGTLPVVNPTTGGGGFTFYSTGTVFIAETGVSGLTSGESATLAKLNGTLDANIVEVNSVPVTGSGTEGDPWGP